MSISFPKCLKTKRSLLLLPIIAALALFVYGGSSTTSASQPSAGNPGEAAVPVTAVEVLSMDLPMYLTGVGLVQPIEQITIKSQVDGQITKVLFKQGQFVRKGDPLFEIDSRSFRATLDQVVAKKEQNQAMLANAKLDLERHLKLAKVNAISMQALEAQKALVAQLTAQVRGDQAAIQSAQVQAGYTTVNAPLPGRVGFQLVDPGNIVKANDTSILTLVRISPISVVYSQPENALPAIHQAIAAGKVSIDALTTDGKTLLSSGHVSAVDNSVDSSSGTIRLKAEFLNDTNALWPGQSVMTRTVISVLKQAIVVPEDAVQHGPEGLFTYVVGDDNRVTVQPIVVEHRSVGYAAITSGLQPKQRVVVKGQYRLQDRTLVSVTLANTNATSDTQMQTESTARLAMDAQ
ncbi:efflux RND transporter periplasmic adaptor subunit [Pseudomonas sp. B21-015]|uniref:efflux RND transporter periplasmic adaptor subunit n=1 Tax=Pseudomonas sp. B21-015 TaxID=2895473 RepID=UPI00215DFC3C|nr:efflux RND transporter periplasmic adaptor subunit [Pseudomonas sp. B21-015]UVM49105.1 efflux RND transporter periplasmic adaptor subunit [Pseudomonas sp. B21-015]